YSVLTQRSLAEIAGDVGSAEWESNRKGRLRKGADWLIKSGDRRSEKSKSHHGDTEARRKSGDRVIGTSGHRKTQEQKLEANGKRLKPTLSAKSAERMGHPGKSSPKKSSVKKKVSPGGVGGLAEPSIADLLVQLPGARRASMPREIHPMLATLVEEPFDDPQWIDEVK